MKGCPNCKTPEYQNHLELKDYFLTKEEFSVQSCVTCGLLRTHPVPSEDSIGEYYKSDEYLSHGAEKSGLFARAYRLVKGYNLGWKARLLTSLKPKGTLLDYGCGTGDFLAHAQELGMNVRGVEPSEEARQHLPLTVREKVISPEQEKLSERAYDVISMWHVLEHIHEPQDLVSLLHKKLNADGLLLVAVPNPNSLDAQHYRQHWAAWDVPRHLWHFPPNVMRELICSHGFVELKTKPMWFDSFYVSLLSERYKNGNAFSALLWAAVSNLRAAFDKRNRCSSQVYIFQKSAI